MPIDTEFESASGFRDFVDESLSIEMELWSPQLLWIYAFACFSEELLPDSLPGHDWFGKSMYSNMR